MVSNIYLNNIGKYLNNYQGTFSCNTLNKPHKNKALSTYIFNLSKINEKGTHLVAISLKNNDVLYFDSFGLSCENKDILSFIYSVNNKYQYNALQIQHLTSNYCGLYCLAFVMQQDKGNKKIDKFLQMFNVNNKLENDDIVVKYILKNGKKLIQKM